ncbi:MAG TPA: VOC family protein [Kofleriaceae bacterium]|nr:VOC family protein [Kofleriaceae bacterium]
MIKKLSHATVWVTDQDRALAFYTEKLGFEVTTDAKLDGFRWLTVSPRGQDLHLVLMKAAPTAMMDEETVGYIRKLIEKGAMGAGVFQTDDCKKTYEELKGRGVEFIQEPQERPYGVEAIFKDDSGNWFSLTQPR